MEMGEEPLVKTVAHMFKQLCYDYRDQLTAGIIVAGWDKQNGGQVSRKFTFLSVYCNAWFSLTPIIKKKCLNSFSLHIFVLTIFLSPKGSS